MPNKEDNPVPSLENYGFNIMEPISYIKESHEDENPKGWVIVLKSGNRIHCYYNAECDIFDTKENLKKLINNLQNGVETNNEQPNWCNISKRLCKCEGNFCSDTGEQVDSILA